MKKSIPPLLKHEDHQVTIQPSINAHHSAYYHCIECNKWVAWLSWGETQKAKQLGLLKPLKLFDAADVL
tara:strand:- start:372 stop:578 length:207 start_codon:yes stop_codon:yes gene_type:complete